MNYLRKPAVIIAGIFLPVLLFSFGLLLGLGQVLGTPDRLKHALGEGEVYEAAVASLVRQTGSPQDQDVAGEGGIPSSQKAVQDAVAEALPPKTLEKQTAEVLDGVYAWLQGDTTTLAFQVDLTEIQSKLAASLSEQARAQAAQLPPCGPEAAVTLENFDPFGAQCLPAGADPNAIADKTRQEIVNSELFKDPILNANDIKSKDGKPLQEQLDPLYDIYGAVRGSTQIVGIVSVILAAVVVFLSTPLRAGMKRLGIILASVGAISAGLALIGSLAAKAAVDAITRASGEDVIQSAIAKAVQSLTDDMRTWWAGFGLALATVGICVLIGYLVLKKKQTGKPAPVRPPSTKI
jgi:hypothetical protein